HEVDEAVRQLLQEAEARAAEIINRTKAPTRKLIAQLEEHETLDRAQIEAALGPARRRRGGPKVAAEVA
ncbi:MAG: hypothetical protein OEU25_16210, partial [Rhodospirillales bacterium]|nr:hypothetical protein [Rhodospirillales bacterium]